MKELEAVKKKLTRELDRRDEDRSERMGSWTEDAFESLKVASLFFFFAYCLGLVCAVQHLTPVDVELVVTDCRYSGLAG